MYILILEYEYDNNKDLETMITNSSNKSIDGNDYIYGAISASDFADISNSLADKTYIVSDSEINFNK